VVDPDAELVAAARGQPREFLALYDRYFDRVLSYVRLRIRDPAACEDVTSHVFTTALEQIGRFRGEGSFAGLAVPDRTQCGARRAATAGL
jgi:DNA-directed RNA polymerase specialized sigma24 family protein